MLATEFYRLKDSYRNCVLGGVFFLLIILAFFAVGTYMLALQIKADSYLEIESVVVDYSVRSSSSTNPDGTTSSDHVYCHVVEYEIGGEVYRKTCDTPVTKDEAINGNGTKITVYVNPKDHGDVVFRTSTHILLTTVTYVVAAIGLPACAYVLHKARKIKKVLKEYE